RVQPEQSSTYERTGFQIEWSLCFLCCKPHHLRLAHLDNRHLDRQLLGDDLYRLVIDESEGRAQDFMPADDFVDAPLEGLRVEPAGETQRGRHVVSDAVGFKLME